MKFRIQLITATDWVCWFNGLDHVSNWSHKNICATPRMFREMNTKSSFSVPQSRNSYQTSNIRAQVLRTIYSKLVEHKFISANMASSKMLISLFAAHVQSCLTKYVWCFDDILGQPHIIFHRSPRDHLVIHLADEQRKSKFICYVRSDFVHMQCIYVLTSQPRKALRMRFAYIHTHHTSSHIYSLWRRRHRRHKVFIVGGEAIHFSHSPKAFRSSNKKKTS